MKFALSESELRERRGAKWHKFPDDVLPAWVADMDFAVAEPVQDAIRALVGGGDYGYAIRDDESRIQQAFAERMQTRFGWRLDPECVLPVADLVQAMTACLLAFSEVGEGVVVQTPAYPPFLTTIENVRRRRDPAPLTDGGARFVCDERTLAGCIDQSTRVLMVCNPHNPTGRVLGRAELEAIGRLAVERDLVVVSDEIHCDLVYPGAAHVPMGMLGAEIAARTITLNSATKGFNIAGLRCGVMHFGSEALLERFRARVPERLAAYQAGLAESGLDAERQQKLREQAALWRFVHVAESQAQAEDELTQALLQTRRHMVHAREANNPADFQVEATRVNPWNDPRVSDEEGVRYSLETSTLCGTPRHVAERIGELRDAGVHHVLCQMSYGYLAQTAIMDSMQRFGEDVIPKFR